MNEKTSEAEQIKLAESMPAGTVCPIFPVSSVNKTGFGLLIDFISRLERLNPISIEQASQQTL